MGSSPNQGKNSLEICRKRLKPNIYNYVFRSNLAEMEDEFYDLSSFAVDDVSMEGMSLLDTVKKVQPNILIGREWLWMNCLIFKNFSWLLYLIFFLKEDSIIYSLGGDNFDAK